MASISPNKLLAGPVGCRRPNSDEISDSDLNAMIASLPPRFYGVCPVSLVSMDHCPVEGCSLARTCDAYNDEFGPGCEGFTIEGPCRQVHEYRTCKFEIDSSKPCRYAKPTKEDRKQDFQRLRQCHMMTRAHKGNCDSEEWKHRILMGDLRTIHLTGRYLE